MSVVRHAEPGIGWDDEEYTVPPGGVWGPGRTLSAIYVAATVVVGMFWLWATAVPGIRFFSALASIYVFLAIGLIWIVCAAVTAWRITTKRTSRPGWYLLVVPAIGLGLIAATMLALPLRAKFAFARSDFDRYAHEVLKAAEGVDPTAVRTSTDPGSELIHPQVPSSIGGFSLRNASIVPEGLIIFDRAGALFDDAGFAYLPDGKFPSGTGVFESPQFRSLGGGWYAFTSGW